MDLFKTIKRQACGALYVGRPGGVMAVGPYTFTYGRTNQWLMFGSYTGNQCTSMAMAAIIQFYIYSDFTPNTINIILKEGNKLHTRLRDDIQLSNHHDLRIGIDDFPTDRILHLGKMFRRSTYICLLEERMDVFTTARIDYDNFPTLSNYLLDRHAMAGYGKIGFLMTIGDYSYAILLRSNLTACLFDSHGNLTDDGVLISEMAGAMEFPSIPELCSFLVQMYGFGIQVVIVPVKAIFEKIKVRKPKPSRSNDTTKGVDSNTSHATDTSEERIARNASAKEEGEGEECSPYVGMLGGGV